MTFINESRLNRGLGYLAMQHHQHDGTSAGDQQYDLDGRHTIFGCRVEGRLIPENMGGTVKDPDSFFGPYIADPKSFGDIIGSQLWPHYDKDEKNTRKFPAWRYSWPVIRAEQNPSFSTEEEGNFSQSPNCYTGGYFDGYEAKVENGNSSPADENGRGRTIVVGVPGESHGESKGCPTMRKQPFLPIWKFDDKSARYEWDDRFEEKGLKTERGWQKFPLGYVGISLSGDHEWEQSDMFFPTDPRLFAVNNQSDPDLATQICDTLGPKNSYSIDLSKRAKLHGFFRVVKRADKNACGGFKGAVGKALPNNFLTWNITESGCKDAYGGWVHDDGKIAAVSHQLGGPFNVGPCGDKHRMGKTVDGYEINPLHIDLKAYFVGIGEDEDSSGKKIKIFYDGPKFHHGKFKKAKSPPYSTNCWLEYDKEAKDLGPHPSPCGPRLGWHRWRSLSYKTTHNPPPTPTETPSPGTETATGYTTASGYVTRGNTVAEGVDGTKIYNAIEVEPFAGFEGGWVDFIGDIARQNPQMRPGAFDFARDLFDLPEVINIEPVDGNNVDIREANVDEPEAPAGEEPAGPPPDGEDRGDDEEIIDGEPEEEEGVPEEEDEETEEEETKPTPSPGMMPPSGAGVAQMGEVTKCYAMSTLTTAYGSLLFRPQHMDAHSTDYRNWYNQTEEAVEEEQKYTPAVGRLEAFGQQNAKAKGGPLCTGWQYASGAEPDGTYKGRYECKTANGGVVFMPPEQGMDDIAGITKDPTTKSCASFIFAPGTKLSFGLPDVTTGKLSTAVNSNSRGGFNIFVGTGGQLKFQAAAAIPVDAMKINQNGTVYFAGAEVETSTKYTAPTVQGTSKVYAPTIQATTVATAPTFTAATKVGTPLLEATDVGTLETITIGSITPLAAPANVTKAIAFDGAGNPSGTVGGTSSGQGFLYTKDAGYGVLDLYWKNYSGAEVKLN